MKTAKVHPMKNKEAKKKEEENRAERRVKKMKVAVITRYI